MTARSFSTFYEVPKQGFLAGANILDIASIGVAAGTQKVAPIQGALRGGYLKTLVTDEPTADSLLGQTTAPRNGA